MTIFVCNYSNHKKGIVWEINKQYQTESPLVLSLNWTTLWNTDLTRNTRVSSRSLTCVIFLLSGRIETAKKKQEELKLKKTELKFYEEETATKTWHPKPVEEGIRIPCLKKPTSNQRINPKDSPPYPSNTSPTLLTKTVTNFPRPWHYLKSNLRKFLEFHWALNAQFFILKFKIIK